MFRLSTEPHSYSQLDPDEWKRSRTVKFVDVPVLAEVLSRDDGLKLICLGNRKGIKGPYYRYMKGETVFEFGADRTHWGGTATDTYSVVFNFQRGWSLGGRTWPLPRSAVEDIAADIDAALRAWPTPAGHPHIPVGVVCFLVLVSGTVPRAPAAVPGDYARYELKFGHPVALRQIPPSSRWQMRVTPLRVRDRPFDPDAVRDHQVLVRDDGVEVIHRPTLRGPTDDGPDRYDYVDDGLTFEFSAERRLSITLVTDTWEVRLNPRRSNGFSPELRARLGAARCAAIIANIEEALFAWPLGKGYAEKVPVNRVVFLDAETGPHPNGHGPVD
ncbi:MULTISPECIES: hypothetical protein [Bradyrhizobium]|uniref:hypothetical protein n=1 Tax=Bradyrhizobium TaxID=374 RepID=UPI00067EE31C|nr:MULTISPECIES: hypothetical protein [Bradyrhizobium]PAY06404.1 hypothetical protein CK489_26310 [Bradyrhizobium sp. UFLA03-84]